MPARLQGWFVAAATATKQPVPALKRLGTRRPSGFAIAVAVISAWAVVANFLRLGSPVIGYDEPFYSIAAWRYVHGDNNSPPVHGLANFDNFEHPPFAKYLFGLAQLMAGHQSIVADRVIAATCTLGSAVVLGVWLGRAADRWVGLGAAALVAILPMSVPKLPFRFGTYGYLDPVAELFAVSSLALSWEWFRRDGRLAWRFASATGASVGLATACKENGFLGAVGPVLAGLALSARDRPAAVQRLLQTLAAVLTSGLVFLTAYLGLGHPISAIRFMVRYQHIHSQLGHPVEFAGRIAQHPPGWAFLWFAQHGIGTGVAVICLVCATAAIVLRRDRLVLWCLAALAGPLIFHMGIARVVLSFYWVIWMPAFLALVALGAAELLRPRRRSSHSALRAGVPVMGAVCVAVLAAASLHDTYRTVTIPDPRLRSMSYSAAVLADSPLVYLRLGDQAGVTATDSSGNGHSGSYVHSPTLGTAGLLTDDPDPAVTFNGSKQYVSIAGAPSMNVGTYTFAIWFRTTGHSQYIVSYDNFTGSKVWDLLVDPFGHVRFLTFRPGFGGEQAVVSTAAYDDGKRHLAVCTKAGTLMRLFIDGRLVASANYRAFVRSTRALPINLARRGNDVGYFAGTLDEFAFFGKALSVANVAALYDAGTLPSPQR